MFTLKIRRLHSVYIFDMSGEFQMSYFAKTKAVFLRLLNQDVKSFVINFENLEKLDCSGVGFLISLTSLAKKNRATILFCALPESLQNTIHYKGLNLFFEVKPSLTEALQAFTLPAFNH